MKYCIIFWGQNYKINNGPVNKGIRSTFSDIDFSILWNFYLKNIIKPLEEEGHEVDILFNIYKNKKTELHIDTVKPKSIYYLEYNHNIKSSNWHFINIHNVRALEHVKDYQKKKNISYDFTIVTRFDIFPYDKITDFYIPDDKVTTLFKQADYFYIVPKILLDNMIKMFKENIHGITHQYILKLKDKNIFCQKAYSRNKLKFSTNEDHTNLPPFIVFSRNVFNIRNNDYKYNDIWRVKDFDNMEDPESWRGMSKKYCRFSPNKCENISDGLASDCTKDVDFS